MLDRRVVSSRGDLRVSPSVVFRDVPRLIQVEEAREETVECVPRFHFYVHCDEESHEEQVAERKRHNFRLREFCVVFLGWHAVL